MALPEPTYDRDDHPRPKSRTIAVLLALVLGPIGLFYVSWPIGLFMLFLAMVTANFTLGLSLLVIWPACVVLALFLVRSSPPPPPAP
jgi:hypothetical protein